MPSLKGLMARREALQQGLEQARQKEADRALLEIVAKTRGYKITLQEVAGTKAYAGVGASKPSTRNTVTRPLGPPGADGHGCGGSQTRTATISSFSHLCFAVSDVSRHFFPRTQLST
jgi:hypothetical protein